MFWHSLSAETAKDSRWSEDSKATQEIKKHIDDSCKAHAFHLKPEEVDQLGQGLLRVGRHIGFWNDLDVAIIISQLFLTEQPQAVTWKEFDSLLGMVDATSMAESLQAWIEQHARSQHHRETDVATELCAAAIDRYCSELHLADVAFDEKSIPTHKKNAATAFLLIEALVTQVGEKLPSLRSGEWMPIHQLFPSLVHLASATCAAHVELWPATEAFLLHLAKNWKGDIKSLHDVIRRMHPEMIGDEKEKKAAIGLSAIVDTRLCQLAADGLTQQDFVYRALNDEVDLPEIKGLILNCHTQRWTEFRTRALAQLSSAKDNLYVQQNAYALLHWIEMEFRVGHSTALKEHDALPRNSEMMTAIWNAATSAPFTGRHAHKLQEIPNLLKEFGVEVSLPPWWESAIEKDLGFRKREIAQRSGASAPDAQT